MQEGLPRRYTVQALQGDAVVASEETPEQFCLLVALFLSSHAGRLHSHAAGCIRAAALPLQRQSHRLPLLSSSRCILVRALESRFVKEGYLLGIAFMGFRSSELQQLLQVEILFSYSAALREPHGRRADGVDAVARR